ncbi:MAG TPA: sulfatase-like hydrolase/transferase [Xanthobacteraceae bacterium]|jgi:hypothetical protein|nr:sulfatase-like hydrolase/transferase [Xanthobacteraceae bacterium]
MRAALLSLHRYLGAELFLAPRSFWQFAPVALIHVVALGVMVWSEYTLPNAAAFLFTWGFLNCFWLVLCRRPAASAATSLVMVSLLVLLSRLKFNVLLLTANFVDLMIVDTDTVRFLFSIYPSLYWIVSLSVLVIVPLLVLLWRVDPFRVRRDVAAGIGVVCLAGIIAIGRLYPMAPTDAWYGNNYVSSFVRSGVDAISALMKDGMIDAGPPVPDRLAPVADWTCRPARKPPHVILIHDESSFDIRLAPGIKVPDGYGAHFKSFDGKERNFLAEGNGGPSWYTEYNVLEGLAARSFGNFSFFVTRIAAGHVYRGLPAALEHCGYRTFSLYPALGAFMSARSYQATTGVEHFYDRRDLGAAAIEPDSFFYDAAAKMIGQEHTRSPMFIYVYLGANHFPWDHTFKPDLLPQWEAPGNGPLIDEYLRRQQMSAQDYAAFLARLKREFPNDSFLLVRYGDHQPDFSQHILEPGLSDAESERRIQDWDLRYFTTYYAIDAINFKPADTASALDTIEGPYLPLVTLEAAGLPLDPSFAKQKDILIRCHGMFYGCADGAEARKFNRMLIDAGLIKNL